MPTQIWLHRACPLTTWSVFLTFVVSSTWIFSPTKCSWFSNLALLPKYSSWRQGWKIPLPLAVWYKHPQTHISQTKLTIASLPTFPKLFLLVSFQSVEPQLTLFARWGPDFHPRFPSTLTCQLITVFSLLLIYDFRNLITSFHFHCPDY